MRTLSVTIGDDLYDHIKRSVPKGKLSNYISAMIEENLNKKNDELYKLYLSAEEDFERSKEISEWDNVDDQEW